MHDAVDQRAISTNALKHVFLLQNNQNQQQNKLVNMVNGSDLMKHNYWPYLYFTYVLLKLKAEYYLDLHMAYIFLNARILQPCVCIYHALK